MLEFVEAVANLSVRSRNEPLRRELLKKCRELAPMLAGNAALAEARRRLPDETISALRAAGLFQIMVPRRFGGLETDFCTLIQVAREIGKACGSTAWVLSLINTCGFIAALGRDRLQEDLWSNDPDVLIAGAFAGKDVQSRRTDDGFVVSGRWPWSSGILHADWALAGVPVVDRSGAVMDLGFAFIPKPEFAIEDTWFMSGMKGTGSNTSALNEVTVPEHRVVLMSQLVSEDRQTTATDHVLYRSSFMPAAAIILIGAQLGLASAALELVLHQTGKRGVAYTSYQKQTDAPTVQLAIAEASMMIETAHLHAYKAAMDIDEAARLGRVLSYQERARLRLETGYIAKMACEAIRMLCSAHGASSFAEANPLQRIWRDSEVASRHAIVHPEIGSEIFGRALLGTVTNITTLI